MNKNVNLSPMIGYAVRVASTSIIAHFDTCLNRCDSSGLDNVQQIFWLSGHDPSVLQHENKHINIIHVLNYFLGNPNVVRKTVSLKF